MVGSAEETKSREAVGMMALHESLRRLCLASDWTYAVFWTVRPRPRVRGGNGCKVGDDNGSLMLMWEDGFCRGRGAGDGGGEREDTVRRAFSKMSIQLYNYGEGLMGKVAADKCHKWVFKESSDCDPNISSNYWQSSFDAPPPEWTDQFDSGIQTIAVIQAGHGLLQLGSCKIIPEDLHFVLRMRHAFESLGYQSGFYLSQMFSSTRTGSLTDHEVVRNPPPPPLVFNWGGQRQLLSAAASPPPLGSPAFQCTPKYGFSQDGDDTHMLVIPQTPETGTGESIRGHEGDDIKWPNGLSFFDVLSGPTHGDEKLLFVSGGGLDDGMETADYQHEFLVEDDSSFASSNRFQRPGTGELLSLDCHSEAFPPQKMAAAGKIQKCFSFPSRAVASSSFTSSEQHPSCPVEYHGVGVGMFTDVMETYLG